MKEKYEIKTVDAGNVDESGFFCYMSKRKEPGYKQNGTGSKHVLQRE